MAVLNTRLRASGALSLNAILAMRAGRRLVIHIIQLQLHAAAAEVGQQALQSGQLGGRDGQFKLCALAIVLFGLQQGVKAGQLRLKQRQFSKVQVAVAMLALHPFKVLTTLQALGGTTAIGAGESAGAELNAAVPASDYHHYAVEPLGFDGSEHGPPGGAAGLTVIAATVLLADFPGPAIVRGAGVADELDKGLGLGRVTNGRGLGKKATLANFFLIIAGDAKREGH